jgi:hypothetical protein
LIKERSRIVIGKPPKDEEDDFIKEEEMKI